MNMDQVLQTFLDESRELLADMERILLELETHPSDGEMHNALFRCVHTVKGSAGMFGLDHVVDFTHVVENVLDRLRADEIQLTHDLANLLLRCRDHISLLVEVLDPSDAGSLASGSAELLGELSPFQSLAGTTDAVHGETDATDSAGGLWHLHLSVHEDAFRHGMDPLSFIRYLSSLGELQTVVIQLDSLPALTEGDPETCYLDFAITLESDAGRADIEDVFALADDLYQLTLNQDSGSAAAADVNAAPAEPTQQQRLIGQYLAHHGLLAPDPDNAIAVNADSTQSATQQDDTTGPRKKGTQHLRVQADKLDHLINLVGELVISSAAVALNAGKSNDTATRESATNLGLLVEEIRDSTLELRMVPIGETFQRFQRVVRDVASELGKDIQLVITGADTELDKTVVEKIGDPLTHLVRNACDHGIEAPAVRAANQKPARGKVMLNAYHESGAIVIEVSDDGGGLDRERIQAKAIERGLIKEDAPLTDQEVLNLIFEPGFSTVEQVTNLSGRGVGMDVVRRNIESLRGDVDVVSPGVAGGTTFRIRLPLTLAIIDGFLARVGDATYVVPLEMVVECTELNAEQQQQSQERHYVSLRGEVLPFIRLREHFQVPGTSGRRQNIIVVSHGGQKAGLVVDELLGEHQTVIKPLSGLFAHLKSLSGSTILGNGQVALILDIPALVPQISLREQAFLKEWPVHTVSQGP